MNTPIQPPAPVDPVITIRPVAAPISNDGAGTTPSPLAGLANGTLVEGFVINRDTQNNPILRTPLGDLQVSSTVFLKTGSEVVFRVDATVSSLARILTVDGLSPEDYTARNVVQTITEDTVSSTLPNVAATLAQTATALPAKSTTPLLEAILLQLHPQAATLAQNAPGGVRPPAPSLLYTQLSALRSGNVVPLTLLDLKLPPLPVALSNIPTSPKLEGLLSGPPPLAAPLTAALPHLVESVHPEHSENHETHPPTSAAPSVAKDASTTAKPAAFSAPAPSNAAKPPEIFIPTSLTAAVPPAPKTLLTGTPTPLTFANEVATAPEAPPTQKPSALQPAIFAHVAEESAPTLPTTIKVDAALPPVLHHAKAVYAPYEPGKPLPTASASTPHPHAANVVEAQVIGHDADGANILHTPVASFKLYTAQPLPTGTTLTVALDPVAASKHDKRADNVHASSPLIADDGTPELTGSDLKPLRQSLDWLLANQPDAAHDLLQRLPAPTAKLSNDLLFFLSAIRGGNAEELLGRRPARLLEQSAPELFKRLRDEIHALGELAQASRPVPWLMLPLPLLIHQQMETLKLYVHPDAMKPKQTTSGGDGQRFILEANLSELGPMQFDGFVRKSERRRSFDLVIRSVKPLEAALTQSIREAFTQGMDSVRMHGQVVFQVGSQHFFHPGKSTPSGDGTQTILA